MTTFLDAATDRLGTDSSSQRRRQLLELFESVQLPTTRDEVWRYAPLQDFSLEQYTLGESSPTRDLPEDIASTLAVASIVIRTHDGELREVTGSHPGVAISAEPTGEACGDVTFAERYADDAFSLLSGAMAPCALTIRVEANVVLDGPIVIVHAAASSSVFLNVRIDVARGGSLQVIEFLLGGEDALVVPVGEFVVNENAELTLATYQRLATSAWHIARTTTLLSRDARMRQSVVGLGSHYNRARNDAEFLGTGASNELHTTFLGSGDQVHDFRTHQNHKVGRSRSLLMSKGAVADTARSVYTGLIEIEKGAGRTDARQTNVNLLLSEQAHADTVPNLDIREHDVVCAHASSVGPLDEMQIWYLESRGVVRDEAERLMVQGFFNEMTDSLPRPIAALVEQHVSDVLAKVTR